MIKLSKSIEKLIKNSNRSQQYLFGYLDYKWDDVVGKTISNVTVLHAIKNDTIYIKCKNATWKNELYFHKKELIKKIQKTAPTINHIVFK